MWITKGRTKCLSLSLAECRAGLAASIPMPSFGYLYGCDGTRRREVSWPSGLGYSVTPHVDGTATWERWDAAGFASHQVVLPQTWTPGMLR